MPTRDTPAGDRENRPVLRASAQWGARLFARSGVAAGGFRARSSVVRGGRPARDAATVLGPNGVGSRAISAAGPAPARFLHWPIGRATRRVSNGAGMATRVVNGRHVTGCEPDAGEALIRSLRPLGAVVVPFHLLTPAAERGAEVGRGEPIGHRWLALRYGRDRALHGAWQSTSCATSKRGPRRATPRTIC
jgi:hypothetical protein